ncbi:MAG: hypothetical protein M1168_02350 [Candidatus Marsarchaeota archaeon]|nr:hypothetical protein [Candidatus Marsarchaeota archaeon]MCL5094800.1 hypothetical protein [Candidatus Marsarchaeota archaeon]
MKNQLSIIIFSRNDVEDAFELIKDVYSICNEVVVIDQSDDQKHKFLINKKKENNFKKLKIFYSIALGDPAPLRMWGLSKCSGNWVFLIDTDERLNEDLKRDIKKIINVKNVDGFAIKRFEKFNDRQKFIGFTWQIRLYRKNKAEYKGLTHELANINGTVERLQEKYFMNHNINYNARPREYGKLDKFYFRMSYNTMNQEISENIYKFMLFKNKNNFIIKIINSIIVLYEKLGFKKPEKELSNIDYFMFYLIKNSGFSKRLSNKINLIDIIKSGINLLKQIKKWKKEEDSKDVFEISKIINKIGIIKFLGLNKDSVISALIKKYKNKPQGIDLLIYLLKNRYRQIKKNT